MVPFWCPRPAGAAGAGAGAKGPKEPTFFALDTKWKGIVPDTAVINEDKHPPGLLELIAVDFTLENGPKGGKGCLAEGAELKPFNE